MQGKENHMDERRLLDLSVLYVEDDFVTQEEVGLFLRRQVRQVATAMNGQEGLEQFEKERPDLIVTDIRMPVMDGFQMVRSIRSMDQNIPIIITTAHSDIASMLDAIDIGIDQYVIKPIRTGKLAAAIDKCAENIECRRARRRLQAEREKLIADLQKALAEIKTLQGILPICMFCKKIRDDKGAWQQIEVYIRDHSEAEFSHGICTECMKKHYGEILKSKRDKDISSK
jgi:YesN/AraC family two-component response regulator